MQLSGTAGREGRSILGSRNSECKGREVRISLSVWQGLKKVPLGDHSRELTHHCCDGVWTRSSVNREKADNNAKSGHYGKVFSSRDNSRNEGREV